MGALRPDAIERASRVRLMLFDVDGVLTDGRLWYGPAGEAMKAFHVLDGHGIKLLARAGVAGVIDESAHPASFFAQRLERKAEQQREQQNLKNVAFGEGADGAVGDDVEQEIDAAVSGGRMDIFGDGGRVRRAGEARAR